MLKEIGPAGRLCWLQQSDRLAVMAAAFEPRGARCAQQYPPHALRLREAVVPVLAWFSDLHIRPPSSAHRRETCRARMAGRPPLGIQDPVTRRSGSLHRAIPEEGVLASLLKEIGQAGRLCRLQQSDRLVVVAAVLELRVASCVIVAAHSNTLNELFEYTKQSYRCLCGFRICTSDHRATCIAGKPAGYAWQVGRHTECEIRLSRI